MLRWFLDWDPAITKVIKVDSNGYPPDVEILVKGMDVGGKELKFLCRIPIDPMAGNTDWGLRVMQNDPDSNSRNGENVSMFTPSPMEQPSTRQSIKTGKARLRMGQE